MSNRLRVSLLLLLGGILASVPALAGSAIVGSVAGSLNASVGGQALLPNTTIFSGDNLQVKDGAAVVALDNGSRIAFGRDTAASFLRDSHAVTVVLTQGNVSLFHADAGTGMRVQAGDVTVEPGSGFKTLGDVAMLNGMVVVTAKDGSLKVQESGRTMEVPKGKTITLSQKAARAPQTGGSQKLGGGSTALEAGALAAGGIAAILAGIGISRANGAKDAANAATAAGNAATAAANTADTDAKAATAAATAAEAAAVQANATALASGCALNTYNLSLYGVDPETGMPTVPSPFTPPTGYSCSPVVTPVAQ